MAEIRLNTLAWAEMLSRKNAAARKNAANECGKTLPPTHEERKEQTHED